MSVTSVHVYHEYLFHDRHVRPTRAYEQRDKLVSGHASVEWVMGRYLTPDTVLRDRRQK